MNTSIMLTKCIRNSIFIYFESFIQIAIYRLMYILYSILCFKIVLLKVTNANKVVSEKMDYNVFQFCLQQNNRMMLFGFNVNKIITILGDKYMCKFICKPNVIDKNLLI